MGVKPGMLKNESSPVQRKASFKKGGHDVESVKIARKRTVGNV